MSIPTTICRTLRADRNDRGATAAEYALIASLVAVVIILAVLFLGTNLLDLFDSSASSYADATSSRIGTSVPVGGPIRVENGMRPRGDREVRPAP